MSKLGIKKDLQAKAGIPIPAPKRLDKHTAQFPNGWEFPVANLVNVVFEGEKSISRNGVEEKVPALTFVYKAKDGKQFTQVEFPIDMDDEKFDNKHNALTQRIKHIFEEVLGESKFEEIEADTYAESWDAARKKVQASMEGLYDSILDDKFFIKMTNAVAGVISMI